MDIALSLLPIVALTVALAVFKVKAHVATFGAAALALAVACVAFHANLPCARLLPVVAEGVGFALYPIGLVVLAALFVYSLTVESGAMATIRDGLSRVSPDPRVLALLIVWGFGNFMEGMAGFGTAVAVPAAILVGVGFDPAKAVLMCLVANTTPTAYGSVGVPVAMLAKVGGCDVRALAATVAYLQFAVTALGPFLILLVYGGRASLRGLFGLALVADVAFLVPSLLAARFLGPELPDVLGGLAADGRGGAARRLGESPGGGERDGRGHRKDDLSAVHCHRNGGRAHSGARGRDLPAGVPLVPGRPSAGVPRLRRRGLLPLNRHLLWNGI